MLLKGGLFVGGAIIGAIVIILMNLPGGSNITLKISRGECIVEEVTQDSSTLLVNYTIENIGTETAKLLKAEVSWVDSNVIENAITEGVLFPTLFSTGDPLDRTLKFALKNPFIGDTASFALKHIWFESGKIRETTPDETLSCILPNSFADVSSIY